MYDDSDRGTRNKLKVSGRYGRKVTEEMLSETEIIQRRIKDNEKI